jgi:tRNA modification GTPase
VARQDVSVELTGIDAALRQLAARGRCGRLIREGRTVVITGRPNTGKSSLFNALLGTPRAIVTEMAGTTRDLLTERVDVHGVPLTLVDTAGVRAVTEAIETEGVERAMQARSVAQMVLVVLDGSLPLSSDDERVLAETASCPRVIVVSKSDLMRAWSEESVATHGSPIRVSARTGAGLDDLRRAMVADALESPEERETPAITNVRHLGLIELAIAALAGAISAVQAGATEELVLAEIGDARRALEEVSGRRAPDDLLRHIFSKFCIGK